MCVCVHLIRSLLSFRRKDDIDLTKDDSNDCMFPPKRMVIKYPIKRMPNIVEPTGNDENVCQASFAETGRTQHSTSTDILNDEIVVISSTAVNNPKRIIEGLTVISDITLVSAAKPPLQKEIADISKPKIGPKSKFRASSDCVTKIVSNQSPIRKALSPIIQIQSPIRQIQSPKGQTSSPIQQTQSPIRQIQSPIHQIQSPIRQIKSPIRQMQSQIPSPVRQIQSPIRQRQSPMLREQSAIMFPEEPSQNNIKQTFNAQSQSQSATVIREDKTKPPSLNIQQTFNSQPKKKSETIIPKDCIELPSLLNNIRQAFNAQISVIQHEFEKYLVTIPASDWSLKHFWTEFLKMNHQNDCITPNEGNVLQSDVNEILQNRSSILNEYQPTHVSTYLLHSVDNSATTTDIEAKLEEMFEWNASNANNLEIHDFPPGRPSESVGDVTTQDLITNLNRSDNDEANPQQVGESYTKSGSTAPSTEEGVLAPGDEMFQKQSSIDIAECLPIITNVRTISPVENISTIADIKIKREKMSESNESYGSDVEIIDVLQESPIEIMDVSTQDLINNLELDRNDSQDQAKFVRPFSIPQQIAETYTNIESKASSTSKCFLTTLPSYKNKKRVYKPLDIAVQSLKDIPAVVLPNHDFSQQPDSPSPQENYEIEEFTMTDSQIQRYEFLNNENSIFVSSQLENYELVPKPIHATVIRSTVKEPVAQKRPSSTLCLEPDNKRRRIANNIVYHELHWKILNLKTFIIQPLFQNTFSLEIQLRNNFDKFYLNDEPSIKRLLNVSDNVWKHVVNILKALNGFEYQVSTNPTSQKSDVLHRIMDNFVRSIPMFVKSRIHFRDFMGNLLEVTEQRPLDKKCVDSAIDPDVLKRMIEFKKNLNNKIE